MVGGPGTGKTTLLLAAVASGWRRARIPRARSLLVGSRRAAAELRERLAMPAARTMGRTTLASRWCARCTPTRSGCCGCTPPATAIRRRGCWPAPSRTPWCATCCGGEVDGDAPGLGLAGAARARRWPCRASPPSCASCCCAPPNGGWARTSSPSWAAGTRCPSGSRRGGSSACYEQVVLLRGAAGRGAPQATAPALDAAELVAAALDALAADPELLAAERERVRHLARRRRAGPRPAADGAGARRSGAARAPCCSRAIPTRPSSGSAAPTRPAWASGGRRCS